MRTVTFFANGDPVAQPRPRAFARKMGNAYVARVYNPDTADGWKREIVRVAGPFVEQRFTAAVHLGIELVFRRPKDHFKANGQYMGSPVLKADVPRFVTKKPDCDNCAKAVMDALTAANLWNDDKQVVSLSIQKRYGEMPGAQITVSEIE